jgi:hypothetical protein
LYWLAPKRAGRFEDHQAGEDAAWGTASDVRS